MLPFHLLHAYTYFMTTPPHSQNDAHLDLPCLCALLRKAGRVVTKEFDGYLKGSVLRITQYSLLMNIRFNPGITVSQLSELLRMDQTTVTRNVKILEKLETVSIEQDRFDHRIKRISVTDHGKSVLRKTRSAWEEAQHNVTQTLGIEQTKALINALQRLTAG